jgi:hypothetical protein
MEEELDSFPFVLALDLGQPLHVIDAMPFPDYVAWMAFYEYRAAMTDFERKRAGG